MTQHQSKPGDHFRPDLRRHQLQHNSCLRIWTDLSNDKGAVENDRVCLWRKHGKIGKDPRHCGSSATVYLLVGTVLLPWCPQELKMREVQLLSDSTTSAGLLRLGMNGMNRESIVSLSDKQELAVTKSQLAAPVRVRVPFLNGEKLLTRHEDRGITWTV